MSRDNWADRFSNEERVIFQKGGWTLTEDGEKIWSLYFDDKCVEPVLDFNKYKLFPKGFLLYLENSMRKSYSLFSEDSSLPIFSISGSDSFLEVDYNFITFSNRNTSATFDVNTLLKMNIRSDNQIGLDI